MKILMLLIGPLISVFLCLIYYVFLSYPKYAKTDFLPPLILPFISILIFMFGITYGKYVAKIKFGPTLIFSILLMLLFLIFSNYIDNKYKYILKHYYQSTGYTNLMHLIDYKYKKGNYITVATELERKGIVVTSLLEGSNNLQNRSDPEEQVSYTQSIYYANENYYILFDWDREQIVKYLQKNQIEKLLVQKTKLSDIKTIVHTPKALYIEQEDGETTLYKIVPENNEFQFIE
ncbi:MAG: hypothetical protein ACQEWE_16080 [Bacillota bacterium]